MCDIESAQRDRPLQSTNQRLTLGNAFGATEGRIVELSVVVLLHRSVELTRELTEQWLVAVHQTFHVGLRSAAERTVLITEEVTTEVTLGLLNILELVEPGITSQLFAELRRILEGRDNVVNANNNAFVTIPSVSYPNIIIGMRGLKPKCAQGIRKLRMEW